MGGWEAANEVRILCAATVLSKLSLLLWILALSTSHWYALDTATPIYINVTEKWFISSHSGIWKYCRTTFTNQSGTGVVVETCRYYRWYLPAASVVQNPLVDSNFLVFRKTNATFSVVVLFLMLMAIFFSFYSLRHPLYMYKRLSGGIHLLSAITVVVIIEVLVTSVHYEIQHLPVAHPSGSRWRYGYSFVLAWCTAFLCGVVGVAFLVFSRKKKKGYLSSRPEEDVLRYQSPIIGR